MPVPALPSGIDVTPFPPFGPGESPTPQRHNPACRMEEEEEDQAPADPRALLACCCCSPTTPARKTVQDARAHRVSVHIAVLPMARRRSAPSLARGEKGRGVTLLPGTSTQTIAAMAKISLQPTSSAAPSTVAPPPGGSTSLTSRRMCVSSSSELFFKTRTGADMALVPPNHLHCSHALTRSRLLRSAPHVCLPACPTTRLACLPPSPGRRLAPKGVQADLPAPGMDGGGAD